MNNNNNQTKEKYYLFCSGEYTLEISRERDSLDSYWYSDISYMLDMSTSKEDYNSIDDFENHLTYETLSIDEVYLSIDEYKEVKRLIREDPYVANEYVEYELPESGRKEVESFQGDIFDWNGDQEEKEEIIAYLKNKELAAA